MVIWKHLWVRFIGMLTTRLGDEKSPDERRPK